MSLIGWIIIAMIVVTAIAVILTVWSSKMGNWNMLHPAGLFAVVCSLFAITFGSEQLAFGHTADQVVATVVVGILATAAIVLTLVQLRTCVDTHRWNESHGHG